MPRLARVHRVDAPVMQGARKPGGRLLSAWTHPSHAEALPPGASFEKVKGLPREVFFVIQESTA